MTFTISYAWWWVPTLITVVGVIWAFSLDDGGGYLSGIGNLIALAPVFAVSAIAWAVAGFFK